jgi:hypothetical protein
MNTEILSEKLKGRNCLVDPSVDGKNNLKSKSGIYTCLSIWIELHCLGIQFNGGMF